MSRASRQKRAMRPSHKGVVQHSSARRARAVIIRQGEDVSGPPAIQRCSRRRTGSPGGRSRHDHGHALHAVTNDTVETPPKAVVGVCTLREVSTLRVHLAWSILASALITHGTTQGQVRFTCTELVAGGARPKSWKFAMKFAHCTLVTSIVMRPATSVRESTCMSHCQRWSPQGTQEICVRFCTSLNLQLQHQQSANNTHPNLTHSHTLAKSPLRKSQPHL